VTELLATGTPIRALYEGLFTVALYEVGRRWERGAVSVSVEHRATAIVEALLADVYPHALARPNVGRSAIVSCAADEFHQVGGRIVADVIALQGWDVRFLGAATPITRLLTTMQDAHPELLVLSVSIGAHVHIARETVLAALGADPELHVFVGGRAFSSGAPRDVSELANTFLELPRVEVLTSLEALETRVATWEKRT
jgi:methanogenic corrinoid protein MtbC1